MPIIIDKNLPARKVLENENIFLDNPISEIKATSRPLKVLLLNIMPLKEDTERDFLRVLSNTPLTIELTLMMIESHTSKNTPQEHIDKFYKYHSDIKNEYFDGMIITGSPVEMLDFEEVRYWKELTKIFDWTRTHVNSTMFLCWGSQAALYHFYGIEKHILPEKKFGVFEHQLTEHHSPLLQGYEQEFAIPHSRHTCIKKEDVEKEQALKIIADSKDAGPAIIEARGGREIFMTGHSEYPTCALHNEYMRDINKGLEIQIPKNYYEDDNPKNEPLVNWKGHGNLLFANWIHHVLYKYATKNVNDIANLKDMKS